MEGINIADRVLILGGSYFVGRKLVEYLADHGYAVTVLNRGTRPLFVEGVEQICCDRNDGEGMKAALAGMVFDYDDVLAVSKINAIIQEETDFSDGLKKSFVWFLENKENIVFKENVDKNLYEMIAELSV